MKLNYTILNIIKKKFINIDVNLNTRVFEDLNLDSLEFVKLIAFIEKKTKTKINLGKINNFQNLNLNKFIKLFL